MPERGQNLIVGAEIFVDRLRLGGRFDYHNLHEYQRLTGKLRGPHRSRLPGTWVRRRALSNRAPGAGGARAVKNYTGRQAEFPQHEAGARWSKPREGIIAAAIRSMPWTFPPRADDIS